jgi:hypothetical protein
MTEASTGLAKALARAGASGNVLAINEIPAADLLASMSDEQKAQIAASLVPAPARAEAMPDEPEYGKCSKCGETMKDGKCEKCSSSANDKEDAMNDRAPLQSSASIQDRVKAVAAAVATDEACKGKADQALAMLADDDFAALTASGLIKLLGKAAATTSASTASSADADEAARAEMKAALAQTSNSNIDATGAGKPTGAANANAVWNKVIAKMPGSKAN